jgi:hypothetical protein
MANRYHATVRLLMSPVLPDGYAGFKKAHLGQCSSCQERLVTVLRFWNGDSGEVHLCQRYRKELGTEDEESASRKSCRGFQRVLV